MEWIFDKKLLQELIDRACGDRQINLYCEKCGVSTGYMMKFMNGESDSPPVPSLLMHMAEASDGKVHFREFFEACGYGNDVIKEYENIRKQRDVDEAGHNQQIYEVVEINELMGLISGLNSGGSRDMILKKQLIGVLPMITFRAVEVSQK